MLAVYAVPPAMCALCRHGFQYVEQTVSQLIQILKFKGPEAVVDMDHAALRVTPDVIGQVGFGKDFGATKSLDEKDAANAAFATMEAGLALSIIYTPVSIVQWQTKQLYSLCYPSLTSNAAQGRTGHCACAKRNRSKSLAPNQDTQYDLRSPDKRQATSCTASPVCR